MAAALVCSRQGHDVELFERFAEAMPLGSGFMLQPTGLAVLGQLGLGQQISDFGHRIDSMLGITMPTGRRVLDVNYGALGPDVFGLAVHRAALFDVLFDAVIAADIPITVETTIVAATSSAYDVCIHDAAGREFGPYDLLVDATGSGSPLHRYARGNTRRRQLSYGAIWGSLEWPGDPFASNMLEQRYVGAHTMIGVLPIGRHAGTDKDQLAFFWSLRCDDHPRWTTEGLDAWKRTVASIWPEADAILEQIVNPQQMTLAQYGHHTLSQPIGERIAFIGDSAHSTSPQLGQGANMALLDAWALGQALAKSDNTAAALQHYAELRRWHVRLFQVASLMLTPFYQSDSRVLAGMRDLFFNPLSRLPITRRLVAGLISGLLLDPLEKLELN